MPYLARFRTILLTLFAIAVVPAPSWGTAGDLWDRWSISIPADGYQNGYWGPTVDTPTLGSIPFQDRPLFAVHSALLYDGSDARLLLFRNHALVYDLETPDTTVINLRTSVPSNGHSFFCAGYTITNDVLTIVGGSFNNWPTDPVPGEGALTPATVGWTSFFDPSSPVGPSSFTPSTSMPASSGAVNDNCPTEDPSMARYYPTCTTLPDGRVLVTGGDFWTNCNGDSGWGDYPDDNDDDYEIQLHDRWAIFDPENQTWQVDGGGFTIPWTASGNEYPRMFSYPNVKVLPYGLFWDGNDAPYQSPPTALVPSYLWWPLEAWGGGSPNEHDDGKLENRAGAACVVLTTDALRDSVAVLLVGGGRYGYPLTGSEGAEIIVFSDSLTVRSSGWASAGTMESDTGRWNTNAVLLPDGKVLVIGGEERDASNAVTAQNHDCEIFTPNGTQSSGSWEEVAGISVDRGHHSVALLLPDGRVFSAGHEAGENTQQRNYSIYYPPYLMTSGQTFAIRDTIDSAPATVNYGLPFEITLLDDEAADIDEVVLMRPCAPTHATDFTQGRIRLSHATVPGDASRLIVAGPKDETYGPPGNYMLFVLDDGVPSEAMWVHVERGSYVVSSGQSRRWGADVWLDRDFEVEPGGSLEILPGTVVHADTTDQANRGDDATRVEVIIGGQLHAVGELGNEIAFRSSRLGTGTWGGIKMELIGVERASYGYVWCAEDWCNSYADSCVISTLAHASIEDAEYGIAIGTMRAPSLDNLSFSNITGNRHIYLDGADVVVSVNPCSQGGSGYDYWNLLPGTHVVASNDVNPSAQISYGDDELVELIFLGQVTLPGPSSPSGSPGDSVYFRPESVTVSDNVTNGDDWGGIILWNKHASGLKYADIGFAKVPVFIYSPFASVSVQNSRIHHFAETGVWLAGGAGEAVGITSCVVARDQGVLPTLDDQMGTIGIHLDSRDHAAISQNIVDLSGLDSGAGIGIDVEYASGLCQTTPSTGRTLLIQDNVIVRAHDDPAGAYSGIRLQDVCGSVYRDIDLIENDVEGWSDAGFEIKQSAAVQVSCNRSELNGRGVEVIRTTTTSNPVRFRHNTFRALAQNENLHAVGTNKVSGTAIGANTSTTGENRITAYQTDTKLARNTDTTGLDATDNAWYKNTDGGEQTTDTLLDSQTEIDNRLAGSVDASDFLTSAPSWSCTTPDTCLTCTSGMVQSGAVALAPDAPVPGAVAPRGTPLVRELGPAVPNPSRGIVDLALAIPARDTGRYTLDVFDAAGRRVFSKGVEVSSAGRYTLQWSGRDGADRRVSAGVFFLRVKGPSFSELRKVVLVQ